MKQSKDKKGKADQKEKLSAPLLVRMSIRLEEAAGQQPMSTNCLLSPDYPVDFDSARCQRPLPPPALAGPTGGTCVAFRPPYFVEILSVWMYGAGGRFYLTAIERRRRQRRSFPSAPSDKYRPDLSFFRIVFDGT